MAILKDRLKSQIQSQFPEHIQARHPQLVEFTKEGIEEIGNSAMTIADNEGLDGHSRSIEYRLAKK